MLTAYQKGRLAFRKGEPVDNNPFEYATPEYTYWWDGWNDGKSDYRKPDLVD